MRRTLLTLALAALAGCGGSSTGPNPPPPPPPPPPGGSSFSATIDGQQWAAAPLTITSSSNTSTLPGTLIFSGGTTTQPSRGLILHLGRIPGPGTYLLGVNAGTNSGGTLTMTLGSQSWWTPLDGDAGSVVIQSMSNGRVKGTFSADLGPLAGGTGTVQVRNGSFDVPINPGYTVPAADDYGSSFTMRINNSEDFTGATIVGLGGGTSLIGATASTGKYTVTLTAGPVDGNGTLPLQHVTVPLRKITVFVKGSAVGYGGTQADVGTMTITSVTARRLAGSFTATLAQVGGQGSMTVTGQFDVKTAQ